MPSTNLPGDSLKGSAGFKYFPGGSTSVAEAVHTLNWPAELVPQGGASYRTNKLRSPVQSLDLEHREVWTIGSGREEATLRLRFDDWPDSLLDMLGDAADGVVLDYYPRLASTNLFFPVHILDAEGRILEDSDRFAQAEYEADLMLRDASTDRQGFWWLKGPNKLKNPRLARTTDGVAEEWANVESTNHNVAFTVDAAERAQKMEVVSATTDSAVSYVSQTLEGVLPGDVVEFSVESRRVDVSGGANTRIRLNLLSDGSTLVGQTLEPTTGLGISGSFSRLSISSTEAGAGAVQAEVRLEVTTGTTSDRVDIWFRDAQLTIS